MPERPNLLFIFTDQQWAHALSCDGNPYLYTHNLDALAGQSIRFTRAACGQPLCVPSRSTLMTGVMPHTHGTDTNGMVGHRPHYVEGARDGRWPMMGRLLNDAGYNTALFGKWHLPPDPDDVETHGFDHVELTVDGEVPRNMAKFIRDTDGPFLAVASLTNPHNICEWSRGAPLRDTTLPPPPPPDKCPPLPDNFEVPEGEPRWIRRFLHDRAWNYITPGYTPDQWRQYLWAYWRICEEVDRQVGNLMAVLRMYDVDENTVVVFSADHGDGAAAHRWTQKQTFYDEPVHVPLVVRPPGGTEGRESDRLTQAGLDILPTLLDYAGVDRHDGLQGTSLRPVVEGTSELATEYVVSQTTFSNNQQSLGAGGRMVWSDRYKYCVYDPLDDDDIHEQFFDRRTDPGEMNNLLNSPDHADEIDRHKQMLADWQARTGDTWSPGSV